MFKHVLVPIDGSIFSEKALSYAQELAVRFGAQMTLLHVRPPAAAPQQGPRPGFFIQWRDEFDGEIRGYLAQQVAVLTAAGLDVTCLVEESGDVADCILQVIERQTADTVVMSTHGRGGLGRWLLGSVADKVLRHTTVPVLLIRSSAAPETDLLADT